MTAERAIMQRRWVLVSFALLALSAGSVGGFLGVQAVRSGERSQQMDEAIDLEAQKLQQAERLAELARRVTDERIAANRTLRRESAKLRAALSPVAVDESPRDAFQARTQGVVRQRARYRTLVTLFTQWFQQRGVRFDMAMLRRLGILGESREAKLLHAIVEETRAGAAPPSFPPESQEPQTLPSNSRERNRDDNADPDDARDPIQPSPPFGPRGTDPTR